MEKLVTVFFILNVFLAIAMATGDDVVGEWHHPKAKEKTTRLRFYQHEATSGKTRSAVQVAGAASTNKSPTLFGLVNVMDDPLTEGPDLSSKLLGRGQGLYASAGLDELTLFMVWSLVFRSGEYNGSSLTVLGRNPTSHPLREMSVVGGTGVFRMARGVLTFKTHFYNATSSVAVLQVDALVFHF